MTDQNLVRRLTTILAIDVVAFSAMSARDEERALALLAARLDTAGTLVRQMGWKVLDIVTEKKGKEKDPGEQTLPTELAADQQQE